MSEKRFDIDPNHSRLGFKVRHLMVSTVRGAFGEFSGHVVVPDGDPTRARAEVVIKAASINTNAPDRDNHLRSGDFFEAEKHPDLTFKSTSVEKDGSGYRVSGDLTIRGTTRPITLQGEIESPITDPFGLERVGTSFSGKLNRKEFGLNWNQALEAGGVVVSEDVTLELDIAVVHKAEVGTQV